MNYHKYVTPHNLNDSFFLPEVHFFTQTIGYIETLYHGHTFYELFYVISGSITHIINGKTEKLTTGDLVILRPGDCHMFTNEHSEDFLHTDILIKLPLFDKVLKFIDNPTVYEAISGQNPFKCKLEPSEMTNIEKMLKSISVSNKSDQKAMQLSLISYILYLTLKDPEMLANAARPFWLKQLLSICQGGDAMSKTKDEIYNLLSSFTYNKSYISRAFKKYMGQTFTEYLNDIRFSSAYNLICFSNESIDSIMEKVGITNRTFFFKEIKRRYNTTPANLRKTTVNH